MRRKIKFVIAFITLFGGLKAQDTFSILAFDSITREVGAAGASCVPLYNFPQFSNDFICELFPDTGAIASQAAYIPANQVNARTRMRAGDSPAQLLTWLQANDVGVTSAPDASYRQYGVVNMNTGLPNTAAFTGSNCMNYKSHRVGSNYTIHGNILSGAHVLDSMEARFLRAKGDLACKLMYAMQGANTVGADSRCAGNNTSSLFAFLKVMQPTDTFGRPSFLISLKTSHGDSIEPIDSLQVMFDAARSCTFSTVGLKEIEKNQLHIFPNPASNEITIIIADNNYDGNIRITDAFGRMVFRSQLKKELIIDLRNWEKGIYFLQVKNGQETLFKKLVIR